MDVFKLDKTTYQPTDLIEDFSAMIWSERYSPSGNFELHTPKITEIMALLDEGDLIGVSDSEEVMMVDDIVISKESGEVEAVVTGMSLTDFFRHRENPPENDRWTKAVDFQKRYKMSFDYTLAEAAAIVVWNAVANPGGTDVTRYTWSGFEDSSNYIINALVTLSTTKNETRRPKWLHPGPTDVNLKLLLDKGGYGIRTIRPGTFSQGKVVNVDVTPEYRGSISSTFVTDIMGLRFDIYNGTNRTRQADPENAVIISDMADHMDSPQYVFSKKNYKTIASVYSTLGKKTVRQPNSGFPSGLDKRVLVVDAGQPAEGQTEAEFIDTMDDTGLNELKQYRAVKMLDGSMSDTAPYKYRQHYFLGDLVTLAGNYKTEQTVQVTEYIRTMDKESGERGYPTFSQIDS